MSSRLRVPAAPHRILRRPSWRPQSSRKFSRTYINGEWMESTSGRAFENRNPANTDELVGMFPASTAEDVDAAVDAAREALKSWRLVPAPKRAEILYRAAETLVRRKEDLARDMTREMGKVLAETRGDVQEAIDMTYYMAGEGRRLWGRRRRRSCRTSSRCRCGSRWACAR